MLSNIDTNRVKVNPKVVCHTDPTPNLHSSTATQTPAAGEGRAHLQHAVAVVSFRAGNL